MLITDIENTLPVVEEATEFEYFNGEEFVEVDEDVDNQPIGDGNNNQSE